MDMVIPNNSHFINILFVVFNPPCKKLQHFKISQGYFITKEVSKNKQLNPLRKKNVI